MKTPLASALAWCLAVLTLALVSGCTGEAMPTGQDATAIDREPVDDLVTVDHPTDVAVDDRTTSADVLLDASADGGLDAVVDVSADGGDVGGDAPGPWGDAPLVDLGGILVPVDPTAVPAPGSECAGDGGVRPGDPTIAPPRPIRPLSVSRVTSQRPTFQWVLPEGTTGARVEVCADRCCTRVLQTIDAEGTTVRPTVVLPAGVVFWRMFGRRGTVVGSRASYTWEFGVRRRDAPNDTSWGTIRDFNGDGFDDLFMFRAPPREDGPAELLIVHGSNEGLRTPVATGVIADRMPSRATLGDFSGDGKVDIAWDDRDPSLDHSWFSVVDGSSEAPAVRRLPDYSILGSCARIVGNAATDWNGDGYSDLVATVVFGCDFRVPTEGSVLFIYTGSAVGLAAVPQGVWRLDRFFPHPFVSLDFSPGDLDLDGYGDVMVTSLFASAGTSSVPAEQAVLHGAMADAPRIELVPAPTTVSPSQWESARFSSIGDVDGDHRTDLLLFVNGISERFVYRYPLGLREPTSSLTAPLPDGLFAYWTSPGDLNGDGLADVITSSEAASEEMRGGFPVNRGRVYVFPGSSTGVRTPPFRITRDPSETAVSVYDIFGSRPISPGDMNGDGIDDLVVKDTFERRLCAFYGTTDLASAPPSVCIRGVVEDAFYQSLFLY